MIRRFANIGFFVLGLLATTCQTPSEPTIVVGIYEAKAVPAPSGGFGYDIYEQGQLRIRQPHIPAIAGQKAFDTPQKALQTARLVIEKMQQGIMPPTLTEADLRQLKVL